jgi:hypothetical protein
MNRKLKDVDINKSFRCLTNLTDSLDQLSNSFFQVTTEYKNAIIMFNRNINRQRIKKLP